MLETVIDIALGAGQIVMAARTNWFETRTKTHLTDFVTSADMESDEYILRRFTDRTKSR